MGILITTTSNSRFLLRLTLRMIVYVLKEKPASEVTDNKALSNRKAPQLAIGQPR